jgi:hypothetical protein
MGLQLKERTQIDLDVKSRDGKKKMITSKTYTVLKTENLFIISITADKSRNFNNTTNSSLDILSYHNRRIRFVISFSIFSNHSRIIILCIFCIPPSAPTYKMKTCQIQNLVVTKMTLTLLRAERLLSASSVFGLSSLP